MARTVARKHTAMYSPSSYVKQKVSRAARSALALLRRASIGLGSFIVWLFGLITCLNFIPSIARLLKPHRQRRKKVYEPTESVTYVSGFRDRLVEFFSTESANKKRLLRWVKAQASALEHVTNLSSQWCDGTALCILINSVVAGTCPRHDLLRREHAVNNCRLAMRLVQRNLGIREVMAPEEMGDPKRIDERKMMQYIRSIQNASYILVEEPEAPIRLPESGEPIELTTEKECSASGSGLVVAVVDKRARFTITTQTYKYKNLYVEITGPNREKVRRKIVTTKVLRGCLVNASSSQSSKDEPQAEDEGPPEPIPLDYQVIKPGSYQVNYIPRSLGMYQVAITWGGEHIKNSPFKVRSTTAKNIEQTTVKTAGAAMVKAVSFQDEQDSAADHEKSEPPGQSDTESVSARSRRQSLVRQAHVSMLRDSYESASTSPFSSMCSSMVSSMDHSIDNTSDVFLPSHVHGHSPGNHPLLSRHSSSVSTTSSRSGSILSRSSSIMYSTDRPPAVKTRRKVIRRIIKGAGGTEEVTYPSVRTSSILSSSQMSSMTSTPSISTSMSIDDRSPKFSTSSSSSAASASIAQPSRIKRVEPTKKYAEDMSKALIGQALREISHQVPTNLNAPSQDEQKESLASMDRMPPGRHHPNTPRSNPVSSRNASGSDGVQHFPLQPSAANKLYSSANVIREEKQNETQEQSRHDTKQAEPSADFDQYLKYRQEFLKNLGNKSTSSGSNNPKTNNNDDKSVGTSGGNPRQVATNTKATDTSGHVRRVHKKRKEDKATQCTAQDIKTATGWISRRTVYRNAHTGSRQKDSNGDSALGESEGSVANSSSDKDNPLAKSNRITRRAAETQPAQEPAPSRGQAHLDQGGSGTVGCPVQQRGRSGTQSSSQGRQSTFDSGFSDENGHIASQEHRRGADELRGRRRGHTPVNGRPETVSVRSSVPDTQSIPVQDDQNGGTATSPNTSEDQTSGNEAGTKQPTHDQNIPIEIMLASPTKPSDDRLRREATNPQTNSENDVKTFLDEESDKEDAVLRQFLTVENPCLDSSTAPTPGDSSVGNVSSLEDDIASADCKSNISSDAPDGKHSPALGENLGGTSVAEPPGGSERLRELSLDAMLQTLENDPEYSTREFLRKYRPMMGDDMGVLVLPDLPTAGPEKNDQEYPGERADISRYRDDGSAPKEDSLTAPNHPLPERCHASGVGLFHGIVGVKNNFQVRTISAGDGSLSVTVRGPRPHTVNETNVIYTGDDLYEVIYDVSLAGFYVISVKWAEKHVPDSPFIVKVTF